MASARAVVLIIAHKAALDPLEKISLIQCYRVLGRHPIRVVCPRGMNVDAYREVVPKIAFDFISPKWQRTYAGFNRLKVLPFLYRRYRAFEFILFYELDAFVFRDELDAWCQRGYDYVGAPWFDGVSGLRSSKVGVGNGGFSLRRVEAMLKVTRSFRWLDSPLRIAREKYWSKKRRIRGFASMLLNATVRNNTFSWFNNWRGHEDVFWGEKVPQLFPWFRLAPPEEAARFSFEEHPRRLHAEVGGLPFGCHAWAKYDPDYWRPYIQAAGYSLPTNGGGQ